MVGSGRYFLLNLQFWLRGCQNSEEKDLAASITLIPNATVVMILVVWSHFNVCKGGLPFWQMIWSEADINLSVFISGIDKGGFFTKALSLWL